MISANFRATSYYIIKLKIICNNRTIFFSFLVTFMEISINLMHVSLLEVYIKSANQYWKLFFLQKDFTFLNFTFMEFQSILVHIPYSNLIRGRRKEERNGSVYVQGYSWHQVWMRGNQENTHKEHPRSFPLRFGLLVHSLLYST